MKAREKDLEKFVGKFVDKFVDKPVPVGCGRSVFRCVGYNPIAELLIIDEGKYGWRRLDTSDVIDKECESYCYLDPLEARIIKWKQERQI